MVLASRPPPPPPRSPPPPPLFAQAKETSGKIRAAQEEIDALRAAVLPENGEKDIEVEIGAFDDVVSADEKAARGE